MEKPLILAFKGILPVVASSVWIAPNSVVIGDAQIGEESSVWFGCVVRADVNIIRFGKRVNIQDGSICHVNYDQCALQIGDEVSVGHGVILHGCTLKDGCLIGIGARVLDRAVVGMESLVAAGSVVREGAKIPDGELWAGVPALKKRELSAAERVELRKTAEHYVNYRLHYMGL